jgi:hypothetical protein
MPVLSPAARDAANQSGSGSASGALAADSAVMTAEPVARAATTRASGMRARPAVAVPKPGGPGGPAHGGTSSGNMQPAYYEPPPMVSPLGSAAIPPVPNPVRPVNETVRLSEATDRNQPIVQPRRRKTDHVEPAPTARLHPVVKIFLEAILVFGLCLVLYFIIRGM